MKMNATNIRVGQILEFDGDLYRVHWMQHHTPGNLRAMIQTKLKNLKSGTMIEKRFRADERVEKAQLEEKEMEWLYKDGSGYHFMDHSTYEQMTISTEAARDIDHYLIPSAYVSISFYEGQPVSINLPTTVDLVVKETQPGMKRATATASPKPATLETGLVVQVPQFVEVGDKVRVNTETGEYLERV